MYLLILFVACLLSVTVQTVLPPKPSFKNIIAFGDSYTDNGSFSKYYTTGTFRITNSSLHPSTSETIRSSDSLLWVEHLAELFDDALLFDFARSGATATNDLIPRSTEDMFMQVDAYIKSKAPTKDSIYFLWIGVNDIHDLFSKYKKDSIDRQNILDGIINCITDDLTRLQKSGADHIILMGLIPLETALIYKNVSIETKYQLKKLVSDYNERLKNIIKVFQLEHPMVSSSFYDMHTLFQSILDQSGTNSETHCQMGIHCKDLVWWDDLHPSSSTHLKIAKAIYQNVLDIGW